MAVATLDDARVAGRTIGLRVDINSPLASNGQLADDARLRAHLDTVAELLDRDGRVAILAHQGRPGGTQFSTLATHASRFGSLLNREVEYVDAVFSRDAREAVAALDPGSLLCLENVRFYSEECMEFDPHRAAETHLVRRLGDAFDVYVNDAFAVSHRSQPTVVGFPEVLPSFAGRVMERELAVLGAVEDTPGPRVAILGGAKVDDTLSVMEAILATDLVTSVFVGGLVANVLFVAGGADPGEATRAEIADLGFEVELDRGTTLLERHGDRIHLPDDVAVERDDTRTIVPVDAFPLPGSGIPRDIGPATVDAWLGRLAEAGTVIVNGPLGMVEDDRFTDGTRAVFGGVGAADYAIAGGGDTASALRRFGIEGFDHVSTGGGAALALLSGEALPGIEALAACTIDQPS